MLNKILASPSDYLKVYYLTNNIFVIFKKYQIELCLLNQGICFNHICSNVYIYLMLILNKIVFQITNLIFFGVK